MNLYSRVFYSIVALLFFSASALADGLDGPYFHHPMPSERYNGWFGNNRRSELYFPRFQEREFGRYKGYYQFGIGRGWYNRKDNDFMLFFRYTIEW